MQPYFDAHPIGALFGITELVWLLLELVQFLRMRRWRAEIRSTARRGFWLAAAACLVVTSVTLNLAPEHFPGAAIRPGAVSFAVGMAVMVSGILLRGWSFKTLGRYFTFTVKVSPDQRVVTAGPYRILRHPSYAALMLIVLGIGLASANWVGLACETLLPLAVLLWRIRIEETALLATIGEPYREYAAEHKRLVPLVW